MTLQERPSLSMSRWEVADELDRLQTRIDALVASGIQPSLEQAHRENAALCDRILELRKACDELQAENEALRASLLALANAADAVGIRYFDTDDMSDDVQAMEAATIYAREVLRRNASLSGGRRPSAPVRGWAAGERRNERHTTMDVERFSKGMALMQEALTALSGGPFDYTLKCLLAARAEQR